MVEKVRFVFTELNPELGALTTLPYLPLILTYQNRSLSVSGLLDTGSSVNLSETQHHIRLMLGFTEFN
ncbi:hypothetical protein [Nostoc sp.]|uniref:hypothetical protein n=1 Tax=Nostoc sp. TaxID=1180 RepID=UPI002FFC7F11